MGVDAVESFNLRSAAPTQRAKPVVRTKPATACLMLGVNILGVSVSQGPQLQLVSDSLFCKKKKAEKMRMVPQSPQPLMRETSGSYT